MLDELKKELEENLKVAENIKVTIGNLNSQILGLNNKGKEISYHCTYLQGKIDALEGR